MNLVESLRVALGSLATSKMRSALTMLGIIGVAAVITLVSLGQGVQKMMTEEERVASPILAEDVLATLT